MNILTIPSSKTGLIIIQNNSARPMYLGNKRDINHLEKNGILIPAGKDIRFNVKKSKRSFYVLVNEGSLRFGIF